MINFNKVALTAEEQLNLLISRGLVVEDKTHATDILKRIGYHRLSAYMKDFQYEINNNFIPNANFKDIIELYNFDEELRIISFNAVRKIEIAYRAAISNVMCKKYGSHWFYDSKAFKNVNCVNDCENIIQSEISKKPGAYSTTSIANYYQQYSSPALPPFWMCVEAFTLGAVAMLYKLLSSENQREIVEYLGFTVDKKFVAKSNWLISMSVVRNTAAHNSRLYNKTFQIAPVENKTIKEFQITPNSNLNKTYYYLAMIIDYHLKSMSNDISFEDDLQRLFAKYPNVDKTKMGFPAKWNKFSITRLTNQKTGIK